MVPGTSTWYNQLSSSPSESKYVPVHQPPGSKVDDWSRRQRNVMHTYGHRTCYGISAQPGTRYHLVPGTWYHRPVWPWSPDRWWDVWRFRNDAWITTQSCVRQESAAVPVCGTWYLVLLTIQYIRHVDCLLFEDSFVLM